MYEIEFTKVALKQFYKLSKGLQVRIVKKLELVKNEPYKYLIPLQGVNEYKLRIGDYRLIASINKNALIILIVKVGHRRNIYKSF